jgi:hypothetical protein
MILLDPMSRSFSGRGSRSPFSGGEFKIREAIFRSTVISRRNNIYGFWRAYESLDSTQESLLTHALLE